MLPRNNRMAEQLVHFMLYLLYTVQYMLECIAGLGN